MRRMNSPWIVVSAPMRKMPKTVTQARLRLIRKRKMLPPISCHGGCACMYGCVRGGLSWINRHRGGRQRLSSSIASLWTTPTWIVCRSSTFTWEATTLENLEQSADSRFVSSPVSRPSKNAMSCRSSERRSMERARVATRVPARPKKAAVGCRSVGSWLGGCFVVRGHVRQITDGSAWFVVAVWES